MPHSINARQIFQQIPGDWPKHTNEILAWARANDAFPDRFVDDLQRNMPMRIWQNWDELRNEVQNYTWTMPDTAEDEEEAVVWGGAGHRENG